MAGFVLSMHARIKVNPSVGVCPTQNIIDIDSSDDVLQ